MMPFVLVTPFVFVGVGLVGDTFIYGTGYETAVAVVWLACAVPSPQDFSLLWYAEQAIEETSLTDTT